MSQAVLNQIIEQLQTLEPSELEQLGRVVQNRLQEEGLAKQAVFHQALLDSGLVLQVKHPSIRQRTLQNPIQVQGEPISQTMLRERR